MIFSKRIMAVILMQFAIASQIFASDDSFDSYDARIKCATNEALAMLQSSFADINQLVDIDTGHPTQNGWFVVRSTAHTINKFGADT